MSGECTSENIRFTRKGNSVFAVQLGWAGAKKKIAKEALEEIEAVNNKPNE